MRKLGLIGGMSWVSTRDYYQYINAEIQHRHRPEASAPLLIESLDFSGLARLSGEAEWANAARVLSESAQRLETAGATALVIAANSMHRVYDEVARSVAIPILHIADCVADEMVAKGVHCAALIGTRNVMVEEFYRRRLVAKDVELLPPAMEIVEQIDRIIYEELMIGKKNRASERELRSILANLAKQGAEAVVLGCTELELIVSVDANVLPIFHGARIHSRAAADWILGDGTA